jgi:hypothetical protein
LAMKTGHRDTKAWSSVSAPAPTRLEFDRRGTNHALTLAVPLKGGESVPLLLRQSMYAWMRRNSV